MRSSVLSIAALLLFSFSQEKASAHASPVEYQPAASAVLEQVPDRVSIRFSERIEPSASSITVYDPSGQILTNSAPEGDSQDAYVLRVSVQPSISGTYAVSWQVVSADDGHFTKGAYVYSVGVTSTNPRAASSFELVHPSPIPEALAITLELLGFALWLGLLAFSQGMWQWIRAHRKSDEEDHLFSRLWQVSLLASSLIIVGAFITIFLQTIRLQEHATSFLMALTTTVWTTSGFYALLRGCIGCLMLGLAFMHPKFLLRSHRSWEIQTVFGFLLIFALMRARVSHAAASHILPLFSILVNAVHLLAKSLWIGLLLVMVKVMVTLRKKEMSFFVPMLARMAEILSVALGVGALTGAYIVWLHLKAFQNLSMTHWGWLSLELAFFAGFFLFLRLYQQLVVVPAARQVVIGDSRALETVQNAWIPLLTESLLGIAILFFSSQLIITTPPLPTGNLYRETKESQGVRLTLGLHPYEAGQLRLEVEDRKTGQGIEPEHVVITATNAAAGIGPVVLSSLERFVGGYVLPASSLVPQGTWTIDVTAQRKNSYDATGTFTVHVPQDVTLATGKQWGFYDVWWLVFTIVLGVGAALLYRHAIRQRKAAMSLPHTTLDMPWVLGWKNMGFASLLSVVLITSAGLLLGSHGHSGFARACAEYGGLWHESVPLRDGQALSSIPVMGCMMGMGKAQFHFADIREFAYFVRPAVATVEFMNPNDALRAGEPAALVFRMTDGKGGLTEPLTLQHDQPVHVMILGQDMHTYAHVHPLQVQITSEQDHSITSCATEGHGHDGTIGIRKDDAGIMTGWTCQMGSHHTCYAGMDGVWKECTFPPDLFAWPDPVSQELLDDPSLADPEVPSEPMAQVQMGENGSFTLYAKFPKAGRYLIDVDFAIRSHSFSEQFVVDVAGSPSMDLPDTKSTRIFENAGYKIQLQAPTTLQAGKVQNLQFFFQKNGKNVTTLEPYLSAPMHIAIASSNLRKFQHTHGELPRPFWQAFLQPRKPNAPHSHVVLPQEFGPFIEAPVIFPEAGSYVIMTETVHQGRVVTGRFIVEVK